QVVVLHVHQWCRRCVGGGALHAGERRIERREPLTVRPVRPGCRDDRRRVASIGVLHGGGAVVGSGRDAIARECPKVDEVVLPRVIETLVGVTTAWRIRGALHRGGRRTHLGHLAGLGAHWCT